MGIFEIYTSGVDAWTMLQQIRKSVRVSSANEYEPDTVALRVNILRSKVRELNLIWARCPQPQPGHEKVEYERDLKDYEIAIDHLESLARVAMLDCCLEGRIIAIGYRSYGDSSPLPVQASEWPFLQINFKESTSRYNDIEYKAMKFLWKKQLSTQDLNLLENMPTPIFEGLKNKQIGSAEKIINVITHNFHLWEQTTMGGDTYNIKGQVGAVGANAKAEANNFQQITLQSKDFSALAQELATLRAELRKQATEPEHDEALGAIASAEKAARKGDEHAAKEYLKSAGKWAMDTASKIGTNIAAKAIEQAMGL